MAMQKQEPGRDVSQPRRPRKRRGLPDCDVYMRTGVCVLGMTCLFNHPPERQQLQFIQQILDDIGVDENPESLSEQEFFQEGLQVGAQASLASPSNLSAYLSAVQKAFQVGVQASVPTESFFSAYLSAGDTHSHDAGSPCSLDPSSSSSEKYFAAVGDFQKGDCSRLDSSSQYESAIEDSRAHWSELSSSTEIFDNDADGNGPSNREIFDSLRLEPKYQRWLNCDVAPGDFSLGPKIAEGTQGDIFEVKFGSKRVGFSGLPGSVLKVFKKGFSLQGLKSQWPNGLLFEGLFSMLFQGSMVLEDDRFALLLSRSDMDLRKLIDVTLDKDFPLFDRDGTLRIQELRAYKSKCVRSEFSTPVFSEQCAEGIMSRIAVELQYLHSEDILHRDLKASNILCSRVGHGDISISVADYECSVGVVGTRFWRAPEISKQLKERKPGIHFTREADVYAFAMTCYEIWTGHIPFDEYRPEDYDHVLNGARPTLPAYVPSWVKDLIQRCWHQNPSERPSFSAIVEELESRPVLRPWPASGSMDFFAAYGAKRGLRLERASEV